MKMTKKLFTVVMILALVMTSFSTTAFAKSGKVTVEALSEQSANEKADATSKKPKSITIEGSQFVAKGKKIVLKASIQPANANQEVSWKSSNKKIATVSSSGVVKGIKAGTVKITATAVSNKKISETFKITVTKKTVEKVTITGQQEMTVGEEITLTATAQPEKAAQSFEWKSSNKKIAVVSDQGMVKALKKGKVKITATATDGSKKKQSVQIIVGKKESEQNDPEKTGEEPRLLEAREEIGHTIAGIAKKYCSNGYILEGHIHEAINEMKEYLKKQYDQGLIKRYDDFGDSISWVDAARGEAWFWMPSAEGIAAGSGGLYVKVSKFDRLYNEFGTQSGIHYGEDAFNTLLADTEHFALGNHLDNTAGINELKRFSENQVIIWHGHGGHLTLENGETVNVLNIEKVWDDEFDKIVQSDPGYNNAFAHYVSGDEEEIVYACPTYYFFKNCCGRMDNSFIWMATCFSDQFNQITTALKEQGATVIGFDSYHDSSYWDTFLNTIVDTMLTINPATGKHYTVGQARKKNKKMASYTGSAKQYNCDKYVCTANLYGNENYSFFFTTVKGTVTRKGDPMDFVEGATLEFQRQNSKTNCSITTDKDGKYEVLLPPGKYDVTITHPDYLEVKTTYVVPDFDEIKEWNIEMSTYGVVQGVVTASDTGEPLVGVKITAGTQETYSRLEGKYKIKCADVNSTIQFEKADFETNQIEVTILPDKVENRDVVMQAEPGYLMGYVLDQNEKGLEGASFKVRDANGNDATPVKNAISGRDGEYILQLPKGEYTIEVSKEKYSTVSITPIIIERGKKVTRNIQLQGENGFFFGHCEQDGNTENGKEPIEWIILDQTEDKLLILSKYVLIGDSFGKSVTWEGSSLRNALNNIFLNIWFTSEEQSRILTTTVNNDLSQGHSDASVSGGNITNDKVFLLSIAEVKKYFPDSDSRVCTVTKAARSNVEIVGNGNGRVQYNSYCDWWLRSPGINSGDVAFIDIFPINPYPIEVGTIIGGQRPSTSQGVRPAMWVAKGK